MLTDKQYQDQKQYAKEKTLEYYCKKYQIPNETEFYKKMVEIYFQSLEDWPNYAKTLKNGFGHNTSNNPDHDWAENKTGFQISSKIVLSYYLDYSKKYFNPDDFLKS